MAAVTDFKINLINEYALTDKNENKKAMSFRFDFCKNRSSKGGNN